MAIICWFVGFSAACQYFAPFEKSAQAKTGSVREFVLSAHKTAAENVERFGLNLGFATSWGAEQLNANIVKNPGFEGTIDSAMVIVKISAPGSFSDNESFLARDDNFWQNADYSVRSGRNAGRAGKIISSRKTGAYNLPDFRIDDAALQLDAGDAVAVTKTDDAGLPARWWIEKGAEDLVGVDTKNVPPEIGGGRSLALRPQNGKIVSISSYFDAIGEKAGKMLPVSGDWRLSFWTLKRSGTANLVVGFGRKNAAPFVRKTLTPKNVWTETVIKFSAKDLESSGILELKFEAAGESGEILLDNVYLGAEKDGHSAFRREAVDALKKLQPGFLRDWQGQLGDTIENRLAAREVRRSVRVRPENLESADFYYSIPEFLDLCAEIRAKPWLIVPTTARDEELIALGKFLAGIKNRFGEIIVEFGNENWNTVFRVAGIPDVRTHGAAASRAFAKIREGAREENKALKFIVGGQHANPGAALNVLDNAPAADALAVAPYFLNRLGVETSTAENLQKLFAGDGGKMQKIVEMTRASGKESAVYEVNLHTTGGDAPAERRDEITAGAAGGAALAKVLLDNLTLGIGRQCVYTFSGFDAGGETLKTPVKLWGIVRDLGETRRFRPQGLALMMLNRAVSGDLLQAPSEARGATDVSVYAFKNRQSWSAAVVSSAAVTSTVSLNIPAELSGDPASIKLLMLEAKKPTDTNETAENVRIVERKIELREGMLSFELPPYGLAALIAEDGEL